MATFNSRQFKRHLQGFHSQWMIKNGLPDRSNLTRYGDALANHITQQLGDVLSTVQQKHDFRNTARDLFFCAWAGALLTEPRDLTMPVLTRFLGVHQRRVKIARRVIFEGFQADLNPRPASELLELLRNTKFVEAAKHPYHQLLRSEFFNQAIALAALVTKHASTLGANPRKALMLAANHLESHLPEE